MLDPLNRHYISPTVLRWISEIDQCKGRWAASAALNGPTTDALRHQSSVAAIAASLRFDGGQVGDGSVAKILGSLGSREHLSGLEQEVWGYANALARIDERWTSSPLSQDLVRGLHGLLYMDVSDPVLGSGRYRHEPTPRDRSDHPSFLPHTHGSIPQQMVAWIRWTNHQLAEGFHHPLLVIAVSTRELLRIRPFAVGNGRVARLVTTFLMLRAGYGYARHSAIEAAVEAFEGPHPTSVGHVGAWIDFSLQCFLHQKIALETALAEQEHRQPLSPLAEAVMAVAHARGRITLKGAVEATRGNRNTLKVHFKNLVDTGHLVQHGKGRGTWYAPM